MRRRVAALANVDVIDACDALGLVATERRGRITGVRIPRRASSSAEEVLGAELVVAATGRGGRVPAWLEGLGYRRHVARGVERVVGWRLLRVSLGPWRTGRRGTGAEKRHEHDAEAEQAG